MTIGVPKVEQTDEMRLMYEFCKSFYDFKDCGRLQLIAKRIQLREIDHWTALEKIEAWMLYMIKKHKIPIGFLERFERLNQTIRKF